MRIYQELSSLEKELGVSARMLYTLTNQRHKHYRAVRIPKGGGEFRELSVPDEFLKAVQSRIARRLLANEPISPFARAYCTGGSPLKNALPHVGSHTLLKMDIRHFFDSIYYPLVKEKVFPAERYSESNRILLSLLCVHKDALPQGAPTSPVISNIIMREFDDSVGTWCAARNIVYTRYCDDLTFSGRFSPKEVKCFVEKQLRKAGFFPNNRKTVVAGRGQRQSVTGIVVNSRPNVSAAYRKKLRQELYYCRRFGLSSHMERAGITLSREAFLRQLLGRIQYVLSVDPRNEEMLEYKRWIQSQV